MRNTGLLRRALRSTGDDSACFDNHMAAGCRFDIHPGHDNGQRRVAFGGDGVSLTEDLAACANGGQVVLSEAGWAAVQEQLPGACQVGLACLYCA